MSADRRRRKSVKRKRINPIRLLILIVVVILIIVGIVFLVSTLAKKSSSQTLYLGSDDPQVKLYDYDVYGYMVSNDTVKRGTAVSSAGETVTYNGVDYTEITLDGKKYYVFDEYLTNDKADIVKEKKKYVRTPVTVYEDNQSPLIASYLKKGTELEILSYDGLNEDGSVNMYEIQSGDVKGWVFAKYLTNTKEAADAVYNENGEYDIHKYRVYDGRDLGGGDPKNLDWYPYEKPVFEDNPIKDNAKAMYLTMDAASPAKIDRYLDSAKKWGVDTLVIDIKSGSLAYKSEVANERSPSHYANAQMTVEQYKESIDKAKDAGMYLIGRIVAFNDGLYAKDHPECIIESSASSQNWPSGFNRDIWEFNVLLAEESVDLFGFNEIQFDYIRFPEESYKMSEAEDTDWKNVYGEDMAETLQNFAFYSCDMLHKKNVYVSFDVFGECSGLYVTAYGQYWPALSNVVDAISGMPYTDHFGMIDTWSDPYQTVYDWAVKTATRQKEIPTPAIARTWITCYNVPNWAPTVIYGKKELQDQVQALIDGGLPGGFMTWNGVAKYEKYEEVSGFWGVDYDWNKTGGQRETTTEETEEDENIEAEYNEENYEEAVDWEG